MISASSSIVLGFSLTGSSISPSGEFYGCTNQSACNYNLNSNVDDGSCVYPEFECEDGACVENETDCPNSNCDGQLIEISINSDNPSNISWTLEEEVDAYQGWFTEFLAGGSNGETVCDLENYRKFLLNPKKAIHLRVLFLQWLLFWDTLIFSKRKYTR